MGALPMEHLLVLSAFLFPPLLGLVLLTVVLASVGKSLGLRERYVEMLIRVFEWGAGEIRGRREEDQRRRRQVQSRTASTPNFHLAPSTDTEETESEEEVEAENAMLNRSFGASSYTTEWVGSYCSLEPEDMPISTKASSDYNQPHRSTSSKGACATTSMGYGSASSPSLARSRSGGCWQRHQHGSQASLANSLAGSDASMATTGTTPGLVRSKPSRVSLRHRHSSGQSAHAIIARGTAIHLDEDEYVAGSPGGGSMTLGVHSRGWQAIKDSLYFVKAGVEAIIEDEVTSRFKAEQLASWNMLTRTSLSFYQFFSWKLSLLWALGFVLRYAVILPLRLMFFAVGLVSMVLSTAVVGLLPDGELKRSLNRRVMLMCCRVLSRAVTALIYFHDTENRATSGGICVANHTSPIDVMILSTDNVYALVGQRHGGLLGLLQRALNRAGSHIWFERGEARDRALVTTALRTHVEDPHKLPILVFPEGTCINNTSVMMFKKGSFEVGTRVYPIAMKYDPRFGDAFWNSSEQSWLDYIARMMTSWAIICHVWYLPPMERLPDESAIDFANRVKKTIAVRGGLVDLEWDGQLKRERVPARLLAKQQEKYYHRYSRYTSCSEMEPVDAEMEQLELGSDNESEEEEERKEPVDETLLTLRPEATPMSTTPTNRADRSEGTSDGYEGHDGIRCP